MSDLKAAYSKYVTNAGIATIAETGEIEYCTINSVTRTITIPDSMKIAGVEYDNDTKSIYFKMDKVVQGVDMSTYNIFVNYTNASGEPDRYSVTDKQVDGDSMTFSWEISDFATAARGTINFVVCLEDSTGKHWNTTLAQLTVLPGMEYNSEVIEKYPDVIEQLQAKMDTLQSRLVTPTPPATIATWTLTAEEAEGKNFTFSAEDYPKIKDCNEFFMRVVNVSNKSMPYVIGIVNSTEFQGGHGAGKQGNLVCRWSHKGNFVMQKLSAWHNISTATENAFLVSNWEYLYPKEVGATIERIGIKSYTAFLEEGAVLTLYGWNW